MRRLFLAACLLLVCTQAYAALFIYANRAWMTTATSGTGTITLGVAVPGYATFAESGIADGNRVTYVITEGSDFEVGTGIYTSAGTTLSRDTVYLSKIAGTAGTSKMNLAANAKVFLTPSKVDLNPAISDPSFAHATQGGL